MIYDDYANYTQKYKDEYGERTVVLMEVGSFWEIYNCDKDQGASMQEICSLLNITLSRKNKNIVDISASNPTMAGFPSHALGKFLPLLVEADWTIVLIGQVTPPPNPKREVVSIVSKGTYMPEVAACTGNNYIMCLVLDCNVHPILRAKSSCVGIAQIDVNTGDIHVMEVSGVDSELLGDEIYKRFAACCPNELLIYKTSEQFDDQCLLKVLGSIDNRKVKNYTKVGADHEINRVEYQDFLFKKAFLQHISPNMLCIHECLNLERYIYGSAALVALLRYVVDHDSSLLRHLRKPVVEGMGGASLVDLHYNCAEQLDLGQLCGKINKCVSALGRRYFNWRLYHPYGDAKLVVDAHDEVERFMGNFEECRDVLKDVADLERMFRRMATFRVHPHEMATLINSMIGVIRLLGLVGRWDLNVSEFVDDVCNALNFEEISKMCLEQLDERAFQAGRDEGLDKLVARKHNTATKYQEAISKWNAMLECPGAFKLERNEREGLHIAVTSKRHSLLEGKVAGKCDILESLVKVGSTTSHIKLGNSELACMDQQLEEIDKELTRLVKAKYEGLLDSLCIKYADMFKEASKFVAHVDFYSCAALLARKFRYVRPQVSDDEQGSIWAESMRHPLVEMLDSSACKYIANDIDLKSKNAWMLYGLNAAGKSTLMKMVALNVIMAQSGLFVPCDKMKLSLYKSVFTRISKGDDIMNGRSTFMVEIGELRNILKLADAKSLVIGDELCAGTESLSAISIVYAGIQDLRKLKASFIFASHLHELVDLIKDDKGIRVCHVHVDLVNNELVYDRTLRDGDGPRTYGIEVCRYLGMRDDFVTRALQMRQTLESGKLGSAYKTARYNGSLLFDEVCEACGKPCVNSSEVHHIHHQAHHNKHEIESMNLKNNLVVLCSACHDQVHASKLCIGKRTQTSTGPKLVINACKTAATQENNAEELGHLDVSDLVMHLHACKYLSYKKIIDEVYKHKGISLSLYMVRKFITKAKANNDYESETHHGGLHQDVV